jgi:hypothetical protein
MFGFSIATPDKLGSRPKSNRRRRNRSGQNAILEVGLATILVASLIGTLTILTQSYSREEVAVAAGAQEAELSQSMANYVQTNYQAFLDLFSGGATCSATVSGNVYIFDLNGDLPYETGGGGNPTCQAANLIFPTGIQATNPYEQNYALAVTESTTGSGQPYISALLTTYGGESPTDDIANAITRRIGIAGAVLPSAADQTAFGNEAQGTAGAFKLAPADWGGAITADHPVVYLNYELEANLDQNLQRFSSSVDTAPNKMDASIYMNGTDSATGAPVNMDLNGVPIPAGTPAAAIANAGTIVQPRNGVMGARQVDTQTLTGGSSVSNAYDTDVEQAVGENAAGETINDADNAAYAGHTILANANLDVTSGYRLTAANGLHITTSARPAANGNAVVTNDLANSANGDTDPILNGDGNQGDINSGFSLPISGIDWDATFLGAGGGLMMFQGTQPADPNTGPTGNEQFWIGTWAGSAAYEGVVGFEADGGMRAPIYYDNKDSTYFMAPAGNTNLEGSLTAGGNILSDKNVEAEQNVEAKQNVEAECNIISGYPNNSVTNYNTCGNVDTFDLLAGGVIYTNLGVQSKGDVDALNGSNIVATSGYIQTGDIVTIGTACSMGNGALAIASGTAQAAWCRNGEWELISPFNFTTVTTVGTLGSTGSGTWQNPYGTPVLFGLSSTGTYSDGGVVLNVCTASGACMPAEGESQYAQGYGQAFDLSTIVPIGGYVTFGSDRTNGFTLNVMH